VSLMHDQEGSHGWDSPRIMCAEIQSSVSHFEKEDGRSGPLSVRYLQYSGVCILRCRRLCTDNLKESKIHALQPVDIRLLITRYGVCTSMWAFISSKYK
jgi:hypothetical protein